MPSLGHDLFYSAWFRDFVWNLTSRVPVLCSQPMSVIIPVASPEVYSQMSLVELVRGAISSTQQQNTAALLQTIIGSLDQVLCPMYARRHKPDADVLPLDRRQHGEEESDEVKQES